LELRKRKKSVGVIFLGEGFDGDGNRSWWRDDLNKEIVGMVDTNMGIYFQRISDIG
jgi:hypothetical protein